MAATRSFQSHRATFRKASIEFGLDTRPEYDSLSLICGEPWLQARARMRTRRARRMSELGHRARLSLIL